MGVGRRGRLGERRGMRILSHMKEIGVGIEIEIGTGTRRRGNGIRNRRGKRRGKREETEMAGEELMILILILFGSVLSSILFPLFLFFLYKNARIHACMQRTSSGVHRS